MGRLTSELMTRRLSPWDWDASGGGILQKEWFLLK